MAKSKLNDEVQEKPAEEVEQPVPYMVRKVACEYTRKINLELVSAKRPYESIDTTMIIWADVIPEEQTNPVAVKNAMDFVQHETKARVTAALMETITSVRAADQSCKYSSIAIEKALDVILDFCIQPGEDKFKTEAHDAFYTALKEAQATLQSQ